MTKPIDERMDEARQILQKYLLKKGLRWTNQRELVLKAFLTADTHISVDEMIGRVKSLGLSLGQATVYRTMNLFADAGVAKVRRFDEGRGRFEPAVATGHHDHLICTECGTILEFEDERIEKLQEELASKLGFKVTYHRMELYGLCPKCQPG